MDKRQRRRLRDLLADLDVGERSRLTKRAAKLRKAALRTLTGDARRPELEDFPLLLPHPEEEILQLPAPRVPGQRSQRRLAQLRGASCESAALPDIEVGEQVPQSPALSLVHGGICPSVGFRHGVGAADGRARGVTRLGGETRRPPRGRPQNATLSTSGRLRRSPCEG